MVDIPRHSQNHHQNDLTPHNSIQPRTRHRILGSLNTIADTLGWDQPARMIGVSTTHPGSIAIRVHETGATQPTEVTADVLEELTEHPIDALWGTEVPDRYEAIAVSAEAWAYPPGAPPSTSTHPSQHPERVELRCWTLVTRDGHHLQAAYRRTPYGSVPYPGTLSHNDPEDSHPSPGQVHNLDEHLGRHLASLLARCLHTRIAPDPHQRPLTLTDHLGSLLTISLTRTATAALTTQPPQPTTPPTPNGPTGPLGWSGRWHPSNPDHVTTTIALGMLLAARLTWEVTNAGTHRLTDHERTQLANCLPGPGNPAQAPDVKAVLETCKNATADLSWTDIAVLGTPAGMTPSRHIPTPAAAIWAGEHLLQDWAAASLGHLREEATHALQDFDAELNIGYTIEDLIGWLGWGVPTESAP